MSKTIHARKAIIGRRTIITVLAETVVPPGAILPLEIPATAALPGVPAAVTRPAEARRAEALPVRQHQQGPPEDRTRKN